MSGASTVGAGPDRRLACLRLGLGVVLLAALPFVDAPGRLLLLPAGLLLLVSAARDLLLYPVLAGSGAGLQVVQGVRRLSVPWSAVEGLRVVRDRRTPLLELDLGSTVVVLSRSRLGRPPTAVLAELEAVRPRSS